MLQESGAMGKSMCQGQRAARSFSVVVRFGLMVGLCTGLSAAAFGASHARPDFGPNVLLFDPSMPASAIQKQIDAVYATEQHSEFGSARSALLFLPGSYHVDVPVGFYTEVLGLGASPDQVHIEGDVHADAALGHNNATTTFWRAAEGFSVTPTGGTMRWAVSQAAPLRRMHVEGGLVVRYEGRWHCGGGAAATVGLAQ
jgi:hypothetical protein